MDTYQNHQPGAENTPGSGGEPPVVRSYFSVPEQDLRNLSGQPAPSPIPAYTPSSQPQQPFAPEPTANVQPQSQPVLPPQPAASQPYWTAPDAPRAEPVYTQPVQPVSRPAAIPTVPPASEIPPQKSKHSSGSVWKSLLCAMLVIVLVAGSCLCTGLVMESRWKDISNKNSKAYDQKIQKLEQQVAALSESKTDTPSTPVQDITEDPNISSDIVIEAPGGDLLTPSQVYEQNVGAVVMVYNEMKDGTSTGTGFVITDDGYIITNYHVVEGGGALSVVTNDNREYEAELVGYDSSNDVAVLKAEAANMQTVVLGSSDALLVGDQVVAIGNPLGELTSTLTVGYISAKGRTITTDGVMLNMLQTDAAINSGNSGGPLFNMYGQVIGITTAKYSGNSSSGASIEGIGFAIPMDDITGIVSDLMTYGYVTGAYMGVSVSDMNATAAIAQGLPVGVYVHSITEGSSADKAGIRAEDIILQVGDEEVTNMTELTRLLRRYKAGDTTTVVVYRDGEELTLTITFDERPRE